ncbi:MAG: flagellar protein [Ignavibacteriae bacterium]|jgi:flagellar operon protein|nr:flagellar protein [Ignavibacteriota bacterium]NOG97143.1 flagellar protein [Ignavibacteriota bacterium]
MAEINGIKVPFKPIVTESESTKNRVQNYKQDFGSIFKEELEKVKFSNHAITRLESRNIKFNETELGKIQNAVEKAELKGSKDALVLMNDTALIVNIPNKTVVTAMQVEQQNENIFTNIDSVVLT